MHPCGPINALKAGECQFESNYVVFVWTDSFRTHSDNAHKIRNTHGKTLSDYT